MNGVGGEPRRSGGFGPAVDAEDQRRSETSRNPTRDAPAAKTNVTNEDANQDDQ